MNLLDVWRAEKRNLVRFGRATRKLYLEYAKYHDTRPLLENLEREMMTQIQRLQDAVAAQTDAINNMQQRVHEDVETLRSELSAALADRPELNELLDRIESNTDSIDTVDPVVQDVVDSGEVTEPEAPAEETPVEEAPVEEAPAEELPEDSPTPDTDEVPTGGPIEEAPAEEAPADEEPAVTGDELIAEEAPAEETPEQGV